MGRDLTIGLRRTRTPLTRNVEPVGKVKVKDLQEKRPPYLRFKRRSRVE
jgi:hypothetical protein